MRSALLVVPLAACTGDSKDSGPGPAEGDCDAPGTICTWAGIPLMAAVGADGIPATESGMYLVQDLRFTPDGNAWVLDWNNHRIRKVSPDGLVVTVAGTGILGDGPQGPGLFHAFNHPTGLDYLPTDPNLMAISAWHNSRIELLHLDTGEVGWVAGTGDRNYNGDGRPAMETTLDLPSSVAWHPEGPGGAWLFFMDQANQQIRAIDPGGIVHDIAGTNRDPGYFGDGGPARNASLHASTGQAADPSNRIVIHDQVLYTADTQNNVIRAIDLASGDLPIDTIAGAVSKGYSGDGGDALDAQFNLPRDLAVGIDGEIYVADTDNSCVRVIRDGIVDTFAGQCAMDASTQGFAGDGGPATEALLFRPFGVEVDPEGNVYVADTFNHVVRRIAR